MNLNLCCGNLHKTGKEWVNIDIVPPADLICDITKGIPQENDSVDRIEIDNGLEHLDNAEFLFVMNECWRVLKKEGRLWFRVPNALYWMDGAFGDPTHKRFFVPRSFLYFTETPQYGFGKSYGFNQWIQVSLTGKDENFFTWEGIPKK